MTDKEKFKEALKMCYGFKENTIFLKKNRLTAEERNSGVVFRNFPAPWIKKTCEILKKVEGKTVVEIGSSRSEITKRCVHYFEDCENLTPLDAPPCCEDGHATYFFEMNGFDTHTVDIDSRCKVEIEKGYKHHLKRPIPENLKIYTEDGIEFLKNFEGKIDLLYLDGWDVGTNNYKEKHLEAFKAAQDKLSEFHIISVDDTDFIETVGGKDGLLYPYLIDNGYVRVIWGRQTIFLKIV
jgi:hypothetical protein